MRLGFLELPADERRLYIEQAALRRNVSLSLSPAFLGFPRYQALRHGLSLPR